MSLIQTLTEKAPALSAVSRYTIVCGFLYMALGGTLYFLPGMIQWLMQDPEFAGHEAALWRIVGFVLAIIGWLYVFGGRSGTRQFIAAGIIDRLFVVPIVATPLIAAGVYPHTFTFFCILDPVLALGAWRLLARKPSVG